MVSTDGGVETHGAYVLVGVPGSGHECGHETMQGGTKAANIDLTFELNDTGFHVTNVLQGFLDEARLFSNNSFLYTTFKNNMFIIG